MKVCVVGSGAREHALCDALARTAEVVCVPGNPGIAEVAECLTTPAEKVEADLFVVGPEAPLVDGLADRLRAQNKAVFGPGADGARLEGSKRWMKELLSEAGVPTARHRAFTSDQVDDALEFLKSLPPPWVIKTDGLAAGKGVLVTTDMGDAIEDLRGKLLGGTFGDAGRTVVIEEGMAGPEVSVLALCDGAHAVALPPSRDYKLIGDGDTGANTGGMGSFAPLQLSEATTDEVMDRCVLPTLSALRARGIDYRGCLYAGLMLTPQGARVIEYNVRFGDPESQSVFPLFDDDLAAWLLAAAVGDLAQNAPPKTTSQAAVTVMMASRGYPATHSEGDVITGIDKARRIKGVRVYHAGTRIAADSKELVTAGGRVLAVVGTAPDLKTARQRAYEGVDSIDFPGAQWRRDIAENTP